MSYKTKKTFKTIIAAVLGVVVVGGAIGLGVSLFKKDEDGLKTIHPTFSVGGLTNTGKYEDTEYSIYTKESFGCQGLKVEVDFDSNIEYQAYFYDADDNFVSASEIYEEGHTFEVPYPAFYARLEVTPIWENNVEEKDKELGYFDTFKYGNQLTVKVNETQTANYNEYLYGPYMASQIDGQEPLSLSNYGVGYHSDSTKGFYNDAASPWTVLYVKTNKNDKVLVAVEKGILDVSDVKYQEFTGSLFMYAGSTIVEPTYEGFYGNYAFYSFSTNGAVSVGLHVVSAYADSVSVFGMVVEE